MCLVPVALKQRGGKNRGKKLLRFHHEPSGFAVQHSLPREAQGDQGKGTMALVAAALAARDAALGGGVPSKNKMKKHLQIILRPSSWVPFSITETQRCMGAEKGQRGLLTSAAGLSWMQRCPCHGPQPSAHPNSPQCRNQNYFCSRKMSSRSEEEGSGSRPSPCDGAAAGLGITWGGQRHCPKMHDSI